jgi:hypothetical protein
METNWLYVGAISAAVYLTIFGFYAYKRRWTLAAMGVALTNLFFVMLNIVAPIRGALDPNYAGYNIGVLHVPAGIAVTLVSGTIVVIALISANLALLNRSGRDMLFIAGVDLVLLLTLALPELIEGVTRPENYRIELGEYLQLPGLVAVLMVGLLVFLPLMASISWALKRSQLQLFNQVQSR